MARAARFVATLRVELVGTQPVIWRRVMVNASDTFEELHTTLQLAMGWDDCHLHEFRVGDLCIGNSDEDEEVETTDESRVHLGELVGAGGRFEYEYDFGDSWLHEVVIESLDAVARPLRHAVCLAGERACPPEDCGGVAGFEAMLLSLSDPDDDRHDEWRRVTRGFEPSAFSLAGVNASLQSPR